MEYRKIQKIGGSSYSVTLPREWVKKNNLKEGSIVFLHENEKNEIVIRKEKEELSDRSEYILKVDEDTEPEYFFRKIISVYLSGARIIIIVSDKVINENIRRIVEKAKDLLMGVEVIEDSGNRIFIQDLSDITDLSMEKMLSRLFLMGNSMIKDAERSLFEGNTELAKDVIERDLHIDRIYLLISKQFYFMLKKPDFLSEAGIDLSKAFNIRTVAKYVERICDHAEKIASITIDNQGNVLGIMDEVRKWFRYAEDVFNSAAKSYSDGDEHLANDTIERSGILYNEISEWMKGDGLKSTYYLFRVSEDLGRILKYSSDICETTINEVTITRKFIQNNGND